MTNKRNNDYIIILKGVKLTKKEALRVSIGIFMGYMGALISIPLGSPQDNKIAIVVILAFVFLGYFVIGKRMFNK